MGHQMIAVALTHDVISFPYNSKAESNKRIKTQQNILNINIDSFSMQHLIYLAPDKNLTSKGFKVIFKKILPM